MSAINSRRAASSLAVAAAVFGPARIAAHQWRRRRQFRRPDSIAVLGTAQYDGRPSRQLEGRLRFALELANKYAQARVFTLGGNLPGDRFTEAGVSRAWLAEHGVDEHRLCEVAVGSDTRGSMEALRELNPGRTLVVTDPNHALRAEKITRRAGIAATSAPTPYCPARFPSKSFWMTLMHEVGGLVVEDVAALGGEAAAIRLEALLRAVEGFLRPSRRMRHAHLRTLSGK